jgi:hypothetical protein
MGKNAQKMKKKSQNNVWDKNETKNIVYAIQRKTRFWCDTFVLCEKNRDTGINTISSSTPFTKT